MTYSDISFYDALPRVSDFAALARPDAFSPLPEDWLICCTDIVDSRGLIAQGQYRTVNMISASVITAMLNALGHRPFPFVFAGDGASFAVPRAYEHQARDTLAHLRAWVDREFAINLRAAMLPVKWIRDEGYDVSVARYAVGPEVDYAMFTGGGLAWAEQQMKLGGFEVAAASKPIAPNLTGLTCRWSNITAQNGIILSLLVLPNDHSRHQEFTALVSEILELAGKLKRNGHPIPERGPELGPPARGFRTEARLVRRNCPQLLAWPLLLGRTLLSWAIMSLGLRIGQFDPLHYRRILARNAVFRTFDDGLKMTIDCSPAIRDRLRAKLEAAQNSGLILFGWHEQKEALLTCIVPSAVRDDHIHFVDGASGGYTKAAHSLEA